MTEERITRRSGQDAGRAPRDDAHDKRIGAMSRRSVEGDND